MRPIFYSRLSCLVQVPVRHGKADLTLYRAAGKQVRGGSLQDPSHGSQCKQCHCFEPSHSPWHRV